MTRIAITGHRGLPEATTELVDRELRELLRDQSDLTGLSCLADGADQLAVPDGRRAGSAGTGMGLR